MHQLAMSVSEEELEDAMESLCLNRSDREDMRWSLDQAINDAFQFRYMLILYKLNRDPLEPTTTPITAVQMSAYLLVRLARVILLARLSNRYLDSEENKLLESLIRKMRTRQSNGKPIDNDAQMPPQLAAILNAPKVREENGLKLSPALKKAEYQRLISARSESLNELRELATESRMQSNTTTYADNLSALSATQLREIPMPQERTHPHLHKVRIIAEEPTGALFACDLMNNSSTISTNVFRNLPSSIAMTEPTHIPSHTPCDN